MFLKRTLLYVFGVMQCVYVVRGSKKHNFPHTVHYCCSSMLRLSEMRKFLQSSSFWEARCALIGQLTSALWLAKYHKREPEMLHPLPYYDAVSRHDETKTIKPIINEALLHSVRTYWLIIMTYTVFLRIAPRKHYNVCICDRKIHNETRRLRDMVPAAAIILQRE